MYLKNTSQTTPKISPPNPAVTNMITRAPQISPNALSARATALVTWSATRSFLFEDTALISVALVTTLTHLSSSGQHLLDQHISSPCLEHRRVHVYATNKISIVSKAW